MASSPSISTPTTSQARPYRVFLSFRGEDTRNGFTSHLHEDLCKNQILTFIDNNLERGGDISPSLLTAIQESAISVIIFSENYADSTWCLRELAEILQCKHNGQIVIPVFYGVDPSHVKKQIGKFGVAFKKLKKRLKKGEMDLNQVRSHLKEAATISGWNSQDIRPESKLIKSIVGDILNKLNRVRLNLLSNLIGIGPHIDRVKTLLRLESPQFRIVGLWGMGGIGKTTIARAVFNHISSEFDAFHFVENVSNELTKHSIADLREMIMLKLFEEESLNMGNRTLRRDFIIDQLRRKKVLLVLDDVEDAIKAKDLLGGENDILFYGCSRILVTSRNKQVLKSIIDDKELIYEVEGLNDLEGLQLFSLGAFKQNHPTNDLLELSKKVINYTRGNPLALNVVGHSLFDKSNEEWHSALNELGDDPFPEIEKVLRISYDALCEEEKMIFVDIASFLVGKPWDLVVRYYTGHVKKIEYKMRKLADRCLIIVSKNEELEVHDLLKEMGRSFESTKKLEERTRIWDSKDLTRILKKMKDSPGSSKIEAININLSQVEAKSKLHCSVLSRSYDLNFLQLTQSAGRVNEVSFCWEGFRGLPDELRYLRWDGYPQESLSSNFCAENLVELQLEYSNVTKLWTGKQNIVNLKVINLRCALNLVEFPDVSEGRNIQEIHLGCCRSLVKVSPSIQHLPKLETLNLNYCPSVKSVTTTFVSKVLEHLGLNGCGGIKNFPQVAPGNNITVLVLDEADIREVPSSVELLKELEHLSMKECKKLSIISTNICKLKALLRLSLNGCTNLESFPEILEPMESLEHLHLVDTAITELPSSVQHLSGLISLHISRCQNLTSLPSSIHNLRNLVTIKADGCVSLKTISSACFAFEDKIQILSFTNCLRWDEEERRRVLDIPFPTIGKVIFMRLPWSEIPQWFSGTQSVGSSLTLKLPIDGQCYRLAFYVLIKPKYGKFSVPRASHHDNEIHCGIDDHKAYLTGCVFERISSDIEHMLIWYDHKDTHNEDFKKHFGQKVSLQFRDQIGEVEVTKCGVMIILVNAATGVNGPIWSDI